MSFLVQKIREFFTTGHERSLKAKKHILISLIVKVFSVVIGLILMPIMLGYLGEGNAEVAQLKFGIWAALYAVIEWIGYFDLGIGNGLRNKFAEARAKGDKKLAANYVSSAYAIFVLLIGGVLMVFFIANQFVDWSKLLNVPGIDDSLRVEVNNLFVYVFVFFCLRMVINLVSMLLIADQRPSISNALHPISNVLSLIAVLILRETTSGSLTYLGLILVLAPVVVALGYTIYFYGKDYKEFRPRLSYVKSKYFKGLFSLGIKFFIIQVAVLVIFSTDSIIIAQINGPEHVTIYSLAWRYFHLVTVIFSFIVMPFWSAYTEAYTKMDLDWIKKTQKGLIQIWGIISIGVIFLILIANWFYRIWVGPEYEVPLLLTIFMGLFVIISTWNTLFVNFLNGTGKIQIQLYASVVLAGLNIPLSIYLDRNLGFGTSGVIMATCICLLPGVVLNPIQFKKIINKKDFGIWGR